MDRSLLWRVIRDHRDGVLLDSGMGRSAYLCPRKTCLEEAYRRRQHQAGRGGVDASERVLDSLRRPKRLPEGESRVNEQYARYMDRNRRE